MSSPSPFSLITMSGALASAALLLAVACAPFDSADDARGPGDGGADGSPAEADAGGDAGGATLVQQGKNVAANARSMTVSLPRAPADGHALVLLVGSNADYATTVVGGGASSWVHPVQSGAHVAVTIWVGLGVSNPTADVTITWSTVQPAAVALLTEWAGLSAVDSTSTANSGASATPTVTPFAAQPGQLLFAAAATQSPTTAGPMNGFTAIDSADAPSVNVHATGAYLKVGSAGMYGTSWTVSPANGWDTVLVSLH